MSDSEKLRYANVHVVSSGKDSGVESIGHKQDKWVDNDLVSIEVNEILYEKEANKKLRWKIDYRIMPFLMIIYGLQYLDKTLLNYAAVMGIKDHLRGNEFSNTGTIFYASYLVAEPIAGLMIQKLPVGRLLGSIVTFWGIITSCHAAAKSYPGLIIVRTLLGIFEAPVAGCLLAITSMWWNRREQTRRTGLWYLQIGVAQIVGSLISFGFQQVQSTSIESWQILFIFMGVFTSLVGLVAFFYLPNDISSCTFLTEEEKEAAIQHIKVNQTGQKNKKFKWYQVKELLIYDKQTWVLLMITLLTMIGNGAVSIFASVIIKSFGFSNKAATIIQIPSGVATIAGTLISCYLAGYIGNRAYLLVLVCIPACLGAILLLALGNEHKVGKLFGVYLLNFSSSVLPVIYSWNSVNTSGYTKVTMRNALTLIAFCIGNLIGPQIFREKDAPNYTPAKIVLIVAMSCPVFLALVLRQIAIRENRKRDSEGLVGYRADVMTLDLTDIENKSFRYDY